MRRMGIGALVLVALGCGGSPTGSDAAIDAAGIDAGAIDAASDGGPDADRDTGPHDGGLCSDTSLTASCPYRGYGTTCAVECTFPPTCTFTVQVTWTDGYCCGPGNDSYFVDCVCDRGLARCYVPFVPPIGDRSLPYTNCEFCDRADAGQDGG